VPSSIESVGIAAARAVEGLFPHESEADPVGGHHRRKRHTGQCACDAGLFRGRHVDIALPVERLEDERQIRHTTLDYLILRDNCAVAVRLDLPAQ
jgi:hypothetical protein